jgi:hypothetical protein
METFVIARPVDVSQRRYILASNIGFTDEIVASEVAARTPGAIVIEADFSVIRILNLAPLTPANQMRTDNDENEHTQPGTPDPAKLALAYAGRLAPGHIINTNEEDIIEPFASYLPRALKLHGLDVQKDHAGGGWRVVRRQAVG